MEKTEAIVDTCFLQKLSTEGKNVDNIKKILNELDFTPVVHPYIAEHELSLHSYLNNLVKEGYIKTIEYTEFQKDTDDKDLYESYFFGIYEEMRLLLEARGGVKQIEKLDIRGTKTIYNTHKQGSSMGDVHMILMAVFLQMPIILTEDSDIELLKSISKKRVKLGTYSLQILNGMDLVRKIAQKEDSSLNKKDLEIILNQMGERAQRSEIKTLWNNCHPN